MARFGLITEGFTDQAVLENILTGYFEADEPVILPFLPLGDATYRNQPGSFSNWELVLKYCSSTDFEDAFGFVDYVIVEIDTDRCEEPHFGVATHKDGVALPVDELVFGVAVRLQTEIEPRVWDLYGDRILFAIAVDSMECWLLPIYAGRAKDRHTNCLHHLNQVLTKQNRRPINAERKDPRYYDELEQTVQEASGIDGLQFQERQPGYLSAGPGRNTAKTS